MPRAALPAGFLEFTVARARVVCAAELESAVRTALRDAGTLYDFARRQPGGRALSGRGIAYAVSLPGEAERVVVRHNRHGGLLAPLRGDLFRAPSRAPLELYVSERLRAADVATPQVLGYAIYPAVPGFVRADMMTREIAPSVDLSSFLMTPNAEQRTAFAATADLVAALAGAGARHHDLNAKNVLLHTTGDAMEAFALDVDRVTFDEDPRSALEANLARLIRSARKWRDVRGAQVSEAELVEFAELVRVVSGRRSPALARIP